MNTEKGIIKRFQGESDLQKAIATGKWVAIARRPKKGCKKCHGRGHVGRCVATGKYIPCACVMKDGVK